MALSSHSSQQESSASRRQHKFPVIIEDLGRIREDVLKLDSSISIQRQLVAVLHQSTPILQISPSEVLVASTRYVGLMHEVRNGICKCELSQPVKPCVHELVAYVLCHRIGDNDDGQEFEQEQEQSQEDEVYDEDEDETEQDFDDEEDEEYDEDEDDEDEYDRDEEDFDDEEQGDEDDESLDFSMGSPSNLNFLTEGTGETLKRKRTTSSQPSPNGKSTPSPSTSVLPGTPWPVMTGTFWITVGPNSTAPSLVLHPWCPNPVQGHHQTPIAISAPPTQSSSSSSTPVNQAPVVESPIRSATKRSRTTRSRPRVRPCRSGKRRKSQPVVTLKSSSSSSRNKERNTKSSSRGHSDSAVQRKPSQFKFFQQLEQAEMAIQFGRGKRRHAP